jgi:hypothetical protein
MAVNTPDITTWLDAVMGEGWTIGNEVCVAAASASNPCPQGPGSFLSASCPPYGTRSISLRWVSGNPADINMSIGNGRVVSFAREFTLHAANSPAVIRVDNSDLLTMSLENSTSSPTCIRWGYSPGRPNIETVRLEKPEIVNAAMVGVSNLAPEGAAWVTLGQADPAFTFTDGKGGIITMAIAAGERMRVLQPQFIPSVVGAVIWEFSTR